MGVKRFPNIVVQFISKITDSDGKIFTVVVLLTISLRFFLVAEKWIRVPESCFSKMTCSSFAETKGLTDCESNRTSSPSSDTDGINQLWADCPKSFLDDPHLQNCRHSLAEKYAFGSQQRRNASHFQQERFERAAPEYGQAAIKEVQLAVARATEISRAPGRNACSGLASRKRFMTDLSLCCGWRCGKLREAHPIKLNESGNKALLTLSSLRFLSLFSFGKPRKKFNLVLGGRHQKFLDASTAPAPLIPYHWPDFITIFRVRLAQVNSCSVSAFLLPWLTSLDLFTS